MISLDGVSKKIGARTLFDGVSLILTPGNRYGLTGPNGSGKSTLFKIMMGMEEATSGKITMPKRVGFLRQDIAAFEKNEPIETVIMGSERLWHALRERDELYAGEMTDAVGMRLGTLEEIIAEEDGYNAHANAEILLIGMGIPAQYHAKPMRELPIDLQFRTLLCQSLFGKPEALLLDEPTNHLDLQSIDWLEDFLHKYEGTLVVISHNRHFLNAVTTHTADIDYDTIVIYPGNYDFMLTTKLALREERERKAKHKEKRVEQIREFVARFGSGTRASRAQSKLKEIERLRPEEIKRSNIERPYIHFPPTEKSSGKISIKAKNLDKSFNGTPVISHFSMEIMRGSKVALIGTNGMGKTTLLKLLSGILQPDAGEIERGHQTVLGYFPQEHGDILDAREEITAFDWAKRRHPTAYDREIRSAMGKMLFKGDDAFKKLAQLSGGERARLILAALMVEGKNLLILDEPDNHLDLESVSALGQGLAEFKGTAIVASHDRDLIGKFATSILSIDTRGIEAFDGDLEGFLATR